MAHKKTLYELQKTDDEIRRITTRLDEIETLLANDESVRKAKTQALQAKKGVKVAEAALSKAEEAVQRQTVKLEHNQAALYGGKVTNPKELQDLQLEAAALKRRIARLEEAQLEAMQTVEKARLRYKKAVRLYRKAQTRQSEQQAGLRGEIVTLKAKKEKLLVAREALAAQLPSDEYRLYEDLRAARKGVAVAAVQNEACNACGATLSTRLLQAVRSPTHLARCPSCRRILYEPR